MSFYNYWGKAGNQSEGDNASYHLLVYHCLDVAAVAKVWWQASASLRRQFCHQSGLPDQQTRAWLLFFIALHDLGKFDIRFQLKAKDVWRQVNPETNCFKPDFLQENINDYYHGPAGVYWLYQDWQDRFAGEQDDSYIFCDDDENESWRAWFSWLGPVAGHHGTLADNSDKDDCSFGFSPGMVSARGLESLQQARQDWLKALESLFLKPAGLTLEDDPPVLADGTLLAGFCSVSDWLGSASDEGDFEFQSQPTGDLQEWFESRLTIARRLLHRAGIIGYQTRDNPTIQNLLEKGYQPRQVQCLVDR
ncbi:CRISPR-associated endonuclease Cas3'' [Endozoicomonas sp. ALB032]|uniref:CRISPR-associated endonuclease Cas3'' n=1 Tax=Endozoicomonas sp. ALB032 TaxID=3403082 RepID=UPI003BB70FD1